MEQRDFTAGNKGISLKTRQGEEKFKLVNQNSHGRYLSKSVITVQNIKKVIEDALYCKKMYRIEKT